MREVAIVGAGMTRFGELWERSLRDLFAEAALAALKDAGADRLDGIYVGNMSAGGFVKQEHIGPLFAGEIGMAGVPATRVESACASGGAALRAAFFEVASGASDLVLDPRSGKPASSDVVVAVAIADSAADAIAISRALLVGGLSRAGLMLSEKTRRVEAVLVVAGDGEPYVLASASLRDRVELSAALAAEAPGGLRFLLPPAELEGRLE